MIWEVIYPINEEKIRKILNTIYFRLMIQINKNAFLDKDRSEFIHICHGTKYEIRSTDYSELPRR